MADFSEIEGVIHVPAYCHDERPPLFARPADRPENVRERPPRRTMLPDPAPRSRPPVTISN